VEALLPDLGKLHEAGEVPARFGADLVLVSGQLLDPARSPQERADRLVAFFLAYAERFVGLASGEAGPQGAPAEVLEGGLFASHGNLLAAKGKGRANPTAPGTGGGAIPLPPEERRAQIERFGAALRTAGFEQLWEPQTGRDGLSAGLHVLDSPDVSAFHQRAKDLKLEPRGASAAQEAPAAHHEPHRPAAGASPRAEGKEPLLRRGGAEAERLLTHLEATRPQAAVMPPRGAWVPGPHGRPDPSTLQTEPGQHRRGTDKRLGPNLLWNWLHRSRADPDEADERDKFAWGAFGAMVLLFGIALVVVILVNL
jgi:hypothetical protein